MNQNGIHKAVIHQINPPSSSCGKVMDQLVNENNRFYTFASVHPYAKDIDKCIDEYMKMNIKGWKLNPHIWNVDIDCEATIRLLHKLSKTGLPILSCSGVGLPKDVCNSNVPSKKTKKEVTTQKLEKFDKVLQSVPDCTFILAHSGCFDFDGIIDLMKKYPNTYTDISVQPAKNIETLIKNVGSERLLFGTDYPFVSHAFSILSVLRATDKEEERKQIFYENAKKIIEK